MKKVENQDAFNCWQFKILQYLAYFAVVAVPLYFSNSHWMGIGIPKQLLFTGLVCAMLVFYVWGKLKQEDTTFRVTKIHGIIVILFIILTISGVLGVDQKHSFFGIWQSNLSLFLLYTAGIFGLFIAFLVRKNKQFIKNLLTWAFLSSLVVTFIAYLGEGVLRLSDEGSTLGNSSYLGAYLLVMVGIGGILFFLYEKRWQKILTALGTLSILGSPVFLNHEIIKGVVSWGDVVRNPLKLIGSANAAFLATVVMLVVAWLLSMTRMSRKGVQWAGGVLFIVTVGVIFTAGWIVMVPNSSLHQKFIDIKSENRFIFWNIAQQGFAERPWLGNGFNNYSYTYQEYVPAKIFDRTARLELWVTRPHTIFLEFLSTTGILGLLGYATLLGTAFIVLYQISGQGNYQKKVIGIGFASILFGYTIQNLFIFDTIVPLVYFFIIIGTAGAYSKKYEIFVPKSVLWIKMIMISMVTVVGLVTLVFLPWKESLALARLTRESNIVKLPEMRKNIQDISQIGDIEDTAFIADRSIELLAKTVPYVTEEQKPYVLAEIDSIITTLEQELISQSKNVRAHLAIGNLTILRLILSKERQNEYVSKGELHFGEINKISPSNPMGFVNMINLYTVTGDIKKAYQMVRVALVMSPRFVDGYDAATRLLEIAPNQELENYVQKMENLWNMNPGDRKVRSRQQAKQVL